jgi:hypothetical protein
MSEDLDRIKYYMAAEKVVSLIFHMEQILEFFEEYKIKPDEEVIKAMSPLIDNLRNWLRDEG